MRFLLAFLILCCTVSIALAAPLNERVAPCLACHGESGQSANDETPSLGGQRSAYAMIQLFMFRERLRKSDIMNEMAKDLTDEELQSVADFIGTLPKPQPAEAGGDMARLQRTQELVQKEHCNSCHGTDLSGRDNIPRIAGQREDYLLKTLREYKNNVRAGYDGTMSEVLHSISDQQIVDLAYYIARQR